MYLTIHTNFPVMLKEHVEDEETYISYLYSQDANSENSPHKGCLENYNEQII